MHISTYKTYEHNCPEVKMQCPICLKNCQQQTAWTHIRCTSCNSQYQLVKFVGDIARARREYLGMTRRQLADKLNMNIQTIRNYEFTKCSKKYFKTLETLIKNNARRKLKKTPKQSK